MTTDHKHHTHEGEEPAITRYSTWFDEWEESPTGEWVAYSDVEKLQDELAKERARIDWLEQSAVDCGRVLVVPEFPYSSGMTLRDAIDQAKNG